jgi:hypothetical protein
MAEQFEGTLTIERAIMHRAHASATADPLAVTDATRALGLQLFTLLHGSMPYSDDKIGLRQTFVDVIGSAGTGARLADPLNIVVLQHYPIGQRAEHLEGECRIETVCERQDQTVLDYVVNALLTEDAVSASDPYGDFLGRLSREDVGYMTRWLVRNWERGDVAESVLRALVRRNPAALQAVTEVLHAEHGTGRAIRGPLLTALSSHHVATDMPDAHKAELLATIWDLTSPEERQGAFRLSEDWKAAGGPDATELRAAVLKLFDDRSPGHWTHVIEAALTTTPDISALMAWTLRLREDEAAGLPVEPEADHLMEIVRDAGISRSAAHRPILVALMDMASERAFWEFERHYMEAAGLDLRIVHPDLTAALIARIDSRGSRALAEWLDYSLLPPGEVSSGFQFHVLEAVAAHIGAGRDERATEQVLWQDLLTHEQDADAMPRRDTARVQNTILRMMARRITDQADRLDVRTTLETSGILAAIDRDLLDPDTAQAVDALGAAFSHLNTPLPDETPDWQLADGVSFAVAAPSGQGPQEAWLRITVTEPIRLDVAEPIPNAELVAFDVDRTRSIQRVLATENDRIISRVIEPGTYAIVFRNFPPDRPVAVLATAGPVPVDMTVDEPLVLSAFGEYDVTIDTGPSGGVATINLSLPSEGILVAETSGPAHLDTVLTLEETETGIHLASDDDGGTGLFSRLERIVDGTSGVTLVVSAFPGGASLPEGTEVLLRLRLREDSGRIIPSAVPDRAPLIPEGRQIISGSGQTGWISLDLAAPGIYAFDPGALTLEDIGLDGKAQALLDLDGRLTLLSPEPAIVPVNLVGTDPFGDADADGSVAELALTRDVALSSSLLAPQDRTDAPLEASETSVVSVALAGGAFPVAHVPSQPFQQVLIYDPDPDARPEIAVLDAETGIGHETGEVVDGPFRTIFWVPDEDAAGSRMVFSPSPAGAPSVILLGLSVSGTANGFEIGDEVILGRHVPIGGDVNWASEMDRYVGCVAEIESIEFVDGAGVTNVFVDLEYLPGEEPWYWRTTNLAPRLPSYAEPSSCAAFR